MAAASASNVCSPKKTAVGEAPSPSPTIVSSAPPCPSAMVGRPAAAASSGTMPKSSTDGNSTARQRA